MPPALSGGYGRANAAGLTAQMQRYGWLLAVVAVAVLVRGAFPVNADVSWLITVSEKMLAGQRPYVDFLEVNPPASILLYLPAVALAQALRLTPELVTDFLVFAAAGLSLWFSNRIARAGGLFPSAHEQRFLALFAAVLLVLPAHSFGQREHIALIAFLPALAVYGVRSKGGNIALIHALLAGLGAGFAVLIKPHLVLAPFFAVGAAAILTRAWRPFFAAENFAAAALCAAYTAVVFLYFPEFFSAVLPVVAAIYVPVREPLSHLLVFFAMPLFLLTLAATLILLRRRAFAAPFAILIAAATGFAAAFLLQQKGWPYHSYPMLALALAAALIAYGQRWGHTATGGERIGRLAGAAAIALLASSAFFWLAFSFDTRALRETIASVALRPSIIAITSDIGIGHPLTRQLNGIWAGRVCSQWMATGAMILKRKAANAAAAARYDHYIARDRAMLVEDIRRNRPDFILVDRMRFDWLKWANEDPALARELANYRPLQTVNDILILRR